MNTIVLAFTTLIGVIIFFRIEKVIDILIGDGIATLERQNEGKTPKDEGEENGEPVIKKVHMDQLRDAIYRKNIYGIEVGLRRISIQEIKNVDTPNSTGYSKHALPKYLKTKQILSYLKLLLVTLIGNSMIIVGLNAIIELHKIKTWLLSDCCYCILNSLRDILVGVFFVIVIIAVWYSIYFKTPHESERSKLCKSLKL